MYEVILKNDGIETSLNLKDLIEAKVTREKNKSDTFEYEASIMYVDTSLLIPMSTIVIVRDEEETIFYGRITEVERDFYNDYTISCEGAFSFFNDSLYPPFEFSGSPNDLLTDVIDNHNANVEDDKKILLGNITVEDPNDYVSYSSTEYLTTLEVLNTRFLDKLDGYFVLRYEDDGVYLDYLAELTHVNDQSVKLGENLIDVTIEYDYQDIITRLIPLGTTDEETNETLTIESVNNGLIYIDDTDAQATYGIITGINTWDDVTIASNLLTKARAYLSNNSVAKCTITVSAIDLNMVDSSIEKFHLGDWILVDIPTHDIYNTYQLTKIEYDILEPQNSTITLGDVEETSTSYTRSSVSEVANSLTQYFSSINAIKASFTSLSAMVATINEAYITEAQIDTLIAGYATITSLNAVSETVETLNAGVANITSLLAGNAGVGDLQAINLSSANVVIADATITSAMIASLTADKITSGTIYTSLVTIQTAEEDSSLYISGSTLQINDGTYVRVQIGEDGNGDYNLYLWDANGNVLWDALGLTEAGVSGNGGIIKDVAVADDAAIKGTKLDIESVAQCLTDDGTLIVNAANVQIDDTTLAAAYKTISGDIVAMQNAAVSSVTTFYALGTSDEDPPSDPTTDENFAISLVGTALVGVAVTASAGGWTAVRLTAGEDEYLWVAYYIEYIDGSYKWTTPTCITDDYVRTSVSTLSTDFEVINGQITSKVWQSDIETATDELGNQITTLTDKYSEIVQTQDGIVSRVGDLETTSETHTSQISELVQTADGLTSKVTRDGIISIINQTADTVTIKAANISLEGVITANEDFMIDEYGSMLASNAIITGVISAINGDYEISLVSGSMLFYYQDSPKGILTLGNYGSTDNIGIFLTTQNEGNFIGLAGDPDGDNVTTGYYILNLGLNPSGLEFRHIFTDSALFIDEVYIGNSLYYLDQYPTAAGSSSAYGICCNGYFAAEHLVASPNLDGISTVLESYDASTGEATGTIDYGLFVDGASYLYGTLYVSSTLVINGGGMILGLTDTGTDTEVINAYWADDEQHDLVSKSGSGLYSNFGWAGDSSYATVTTIRGRTCRYTNSSGTTTLSDKNLKEDFISLGEDVYDTFFDNLNPTAYKYKLGNSSRHHFGYITQEVEEALEKAGLTTIDFGGVNIIPINERETETDTNGNVKDIYNSATNYLLDQGINEEHDLIYTEFIALNTMQIQKLKARISALECEIETLKASI